LAALADNGGPTMTCALLDGSPAIDSATSIDDADQRGLSLRDHPRTGTSIADIGAFEAEPPCTARVTDITVNKSYAGLLDAVFTVNLSLPAPTAASFDWQTANDTALAPTDYIASSGRVEIQTGATSSTFKVSTCASSTV